MKVWVVSVGEPIPLDDKNSRLLRSGMVVKFLAERGHEIVWWVSNFDHFTKTYRRSGFSRIQHSAQIEFALLHGRPYYKNISISRILNHRDLARNFTTSSVEFDRPDVVLISYPPLELAQAVAQYCFEQQIPSAVDLRDLWPDIFLNTVPKILRPIAHMCLMPMFQCSRLAVRRATAIYGITEQFLEWGLHRAGRDRRSEDGVFYLAYDDTCISSPNLDAAKRKWQNLGISSDHFVVCFFGMLGHQFDIDTVIQAARILEAKQPLVRFVMCGVGDNFERHKSAAEGLTNIIFPGWAEQAEIRALMSISAVGIAPYINEKSFTMSIPNKIAEYWSSSLPVLSCLSGRVAQEIESNACGIMYEDKNPISLAEKITYLAKHPEIRNDLGIRARTLYEKEFSATVVYNQMADSLESLAHQANHDLPIA